ncbi:MAG: M23 family metallopeptidase [Eubacterium sp.]|nr:M23 family metallopeptidase [Eubacterium sp.]
MKKQFVFSHPYEYKECSKALAAIYNDIKFFPVLKSNSSDYWVSYDNSYGADRNYNGKYKHEGIDIMAENNVSGYYPVISVTDGVVENMGWLEKGGYRVGIRSNSSGYFYYAHLSSYAGIKKGDKIKAGTLLGYMGDTGYGKVEGTSGNFAVHLHFGIYIATKNYSELSVNPYTVLKYLEAKTLAADY